MKIINLKELTKVPDGTVFAEITDSHFKEMQIGDFNIGNINIFYGNIPYDKNRFNGIEHLCDIISVGYFDANEGINGLNDPDGESIITDTTELDYDKDAQFVIFEKREVEMLIHELTKALNTGYK